MLNWLRCPVPASWPWGRDEREVGLFTITLVLILVFTVRGWKAGIIIAMAAGTIIGIPMGLTGVPEYLISMPPSIMPIAFKLDIRSALSIAYIPFLLVFLSMTSFPR